MPKCEVCGNDYDKAFQVTLPGDQPHTFDSFECAIYALAPNCEHCGVRLDDVLVVQRGHDPRLLLEARPEGGVFGIAEVKRLQGHATPEDCVLRLVDDGHPPVPNVLCTL